MPRNYLLVTLAALSLHTVSARAEDADKPMFTFGGFGTVGIVHSDRKDADFQNSVFQPNGVGRTRSWDMDVDSRVAVQVTANLSPKISGVLQVISEQRWDNTYTPQVEWANLKYAFTPDFNVRIGRTVLPAYLISDSRKVSYANPWIRPPVDLYTLVPITNSDGIDGSYRFRMGEVTNTVQASYGHNIIRVNGPENNYANNVWGIYNTTEYGAATFHVAYQRLRLTVPLINHVIDNYRLFGPAGGGHGQSLHGGSQSYRILWSRRHL